MYRQNSPGAAVARPEVLRDAPQLDLVESELGTRFFPDEVREAFCAMQPPSDITWEGQPVWDTVYHEALSIIESDAMSEGVRRSRLGRLAAKIALANSVASISLEDLPSATWADRQGPRARFQQKYADIISWFVTMEPQPDEELPSRTKPLSNNTLVLPAPTAAGKTMLGGNFVAKVLSQPRPDGQRRRVLWVTTTQQLVKDLLNPEKTLQRCLPENVTTTAIWEGHKDADAASGDLCVVTTDSLSGAVGENEPSEEDMLNLLEDALNSNLIDPADFDALVFDEAHWALSERMTRLLNEKFQHCKTLMLTATPERTNWRSLLRRYHHSTPVGRLEAMEQDLISKVRIVSIMAESDMHAEHQAALAAVNFFIKHGRKAPIYCQPGGGNAQAARIASLVNVYAAQMLGDVYDSNINYAKMVGSTNPNSLRDIADFEKAQHGAVLTTTQMAGEGYDYPELDGGIWVGLQSDYLALMQESGRSLRPKADGRPAIWVQIFTPLPEDKKHRVYYTLAQTAGLEYIPDANEIIGRRPEPGGNPKPKSKTGSAGGSPGGSPAAGSGGPAGSPGSGSGGSGCDRSGFRSGKPGGSGGEPGESSKKEETDDVLAGVHPDLLKAIIEPGRPIAEFIVQADRRGRYIPPPEFSVTDEQLAERFGVSVEYVHYHLEPREGVPDAPFKLVLTLRTPGAVSSKARQMIRHYDGSAVEAHLVSHPMPKVGEAVWTVAAMANALHAPQSAIHDALSALKIPKPNPTRATEAGRRQGKPAPRYTQEHFGSITNQIERTPRAEPGDETWATVVDQYPFGHKLLNVETDRVILRHPDTSDRRGSEYFVRAADVLRAGREERRRRALVPMGVVALWTGTTQGTIDRLLEKEDWVDVRAFAVSPENKFTPPRGTKYSAHLTREMALAVVDELGPVGLKSNEITVHAITQRIPYGITRSTLDGVLKDYETTGPQRRIEYRGNPCNTYDFSVLQAAENRFGVRPGATPIDYDAIARTTADNPDPADIAYAREVQVNVLGLPRLQIGPDLPPNPTQEPSQPALPTSPLNYMMPLAKFLQRLPQESRPTQEEALEFLRENGGNTQQFTNGEGQVEHYIFGVSAGLLNYNFGGFYTVGDNQPGRTEPPEGWMTRLGMARATGLAPHEIDPYIDRVDWAETKSGLAVIRRDRTENTKAIFVLWPPQSKRRAVLPYYNPAIVGRVMSMVEDERGESAPDPAAAANQPAVDVGSDDDTDDADDAVESAKPTPISLDEIE